MALHDPRCRKCGGDTRLVAYRRTENGPEWTCSVCAGSVDTVRFPRRSGVVEVEAEASPRLPPVVRRGRPEPVAPPTTMKPRYTGPRARHDPLGF